MVFASRQDAGRKLGHQLRESGMEVDLVVGLPRGGVVVAAEVARILQRPLDVIGVRKIGHPWHREFAVGALAEGGVTLLDEHAVGNDILVRAALEGVMEEENARLREYSEKFHPAGNPISAAKAFCSWTTDWRPARPPRPPCCRPKSRARRKFLSRCRWPRPARWNG